MNILNRFWGNILKGLAKLLSLIFDIVIGITDGIVFFVRYIGRSLYAIISAGGCLIFFFLGPFAFTLLFNPVSIQHSLCQS